MEPRSDAQRSAAAAANTNSDPCILCGETRRTYLVVGARWRMTRCDDCQLVLRADEGRHALKPESFGLDDDSARAIVGMLAGGASHRKVLAVVDGDVPGATIPTDPRFEVTQTTTDGLTRVERGAFDAVFVNGSIESYDPKAVMQGVRAALRPGGDVVIVVAAWSQQKPKLPHYAFSPVPLTRLTLDAGFRPISCGILSRSISTVAKDDRLANEEIPLVGAARLLATAGRRVEVPSGLLVMHAKLEAMPARPLLSIIMPVFNEVKTFEETFELVYAAKVEGVDREIVVVESNSTDGSRDLVKKIEGRPGVVVLYEDRPQGKGHAVRAGIEISKGSFVLIQDADSEYDVNDYDIVLGPLIERRATFVLGSRHLGGRTWKIRSFANQKILSYVMNVAHESFTTAANGLYRTEMRDPTTMFKVFRRDAYNGIRFTRDRFDFDWELVCKLVRRGHVPVEVPVNYRSRSFAEGKKVRFFRDPLTWIETIVTSRFESLGEDGQ